MALRHRAALRAVRARNTGEDGVINGGVMSSARSSWNTPECVLELVRKVGPIALDPCSNADSIVGARAEWTDNGLSADWNTADGIVYVNPPYGRCIGEWVECCRRTGQTSEVIALLPARTDARWFQHVWTARAICFWRGRIRFLGAPSSAPFPSVVAYWGSNAVRFANAFAGAGHVVRP